jgi:hypothetical protein
LRWAGHEGGRNSLKILTGKPTRKRLLAIPRRRWEDNNRLNFKETYQ